MLVSMKQKQADFERALRAGRIARLHFAVRFAQMDLATLREGDWLNLREDFLAFLGQDLSLKRPSPFVGHYGGLVTTRWGPPFPEDFTQEEFRALQADVSTIVRAAAGDNTLEKPPLMIGVQTTLLVQPLTGRGIREGGFLINLLGQWRDMFLFLLLDALRQEPPDRVLRCPQCHTLFVRVYTQAYCSRRCTNQASVRNWRRRQAEATLHQADDTLVSTGTGEKA